MPENTIEALQIYIDYNRLKAKDLANFLANFSFIATKIAEDYFSRYKDYEGEELPTLDIDTANTENSIKFTLIEGWNVKIKSNADADIVVEIPKKLGLPIVIGYLLISIAAEYQDYRNKQLDNRLKELEIQLKQTELAKAMSLTNEEQQNTFKLASAYLDNKVPEIKPVIMDTIKSVLKNADITQFKVNEVEIKSLEHQ